MDVHELDPEPLVQFRRWFDQARAQGVELPEAMTLATATPDGRPSARTVLLKGVDERGFLFYTNYESRKGRELEMNPYAALVFHWPQEPRRQVVAAGVVERLSQEESEAYFRTRPLGSRLSAWASHQSEAVSGREALEAAVAHARARYGHEPPLPPWWGGYALTPERVELWQNRPDRLHDRFCYSRHEDGWRLERLAP